MRAEYPNQLDYSGFCFCFEDIDKLGVGMSAALHMEITGATGALRLSERANERHKQASTSVLIV